MINKIEIGDKLKVTSNIHVGDYIVAKGTIVEVIKVIDNLFLTLKCGNFIFEHPLCHECHDRGLMYDFYFFTKDF